MKETNRTGGKRKGLFCMCLAGILAAGVVLSGMAAGAEPVHYDVRVESSSTHTAALSGGDLYFWGTNEKHQFPGFEGVSSDEPVLLADHVADAALAFGRTLIVSDDGTLTAYGIDPATRRIPALDGQVLANDAVQVDASDTFAAYVSRDGALYTWGRNESGQLGSGATKDSSVPVRIMESGVQKVSVGNNFGLALMEDGSVYGWGGNYFQQLGFEGEENVLSPVQVADGAIDIATGYAHSLILKANGDLLSCGDNTYSQTGAGSNYSSHGLRQILSGVRSMTAGSYHNFAISKDGAVYGWGYDQAGQLGSGTGSRVMTPTESTYTFVQVYACSDSTFGVAKNGSVFAYGSNMNYVLGKTDGADAADPVRILDKEMNWVYESSLGYNDILLYSEDDEIPETAPADPAPAVISGDPGAAADGGEETTDAEPVLVSTPFVSGYGDGSFKPGNNITRAEFLSMLVSALCPDYDSDENYGAPAFSDVPADAWFTNLVSFAKDQGIVTGRADGTFHAGDPITRAEASVLVAAAMKLDASAGAASFTDLAADHWAADSINALSATGIVSGYPDGSFKPGSNIRRSEAVTIVAQAAGFSADSVTDEQKAAFSKSPFSDVSPDDWYYAYLLRAVGYVGAPAEEAAEEEPTE